MLKSSGWRVNHKRVERIWRKEGLKVPKKQPKRGRLWLNDGSCIRLRPEHENHVWSYDFMIERTANGRAFKILNIIDEYTRKSLITKVNRRIRSQDVIDELFELFILRSIPEAYKVRQRPRVYRQGSEKVAEAAGSKDAFHRAREPLGEWLH